MKNKLLIFGIVTLALGAALMIWGSGQKPKPHNHETTAVSSTPAKPRVPAFQTSAANLKPTLSPNDFFGKAREGYAAAKAIPQVLAQLPCYCHCDQSAGHKSLHTCFEDAHASHCVVCIDEALLAYKLQKEDGMTPEQIRETIIKKYSE